MNIDLNLTVLDIYDGISGTFNIRNTEFGINYCGTIYDYNQIQFVTKSGGMIQWLQDYMQFELGEATYIAEQLNNWHYFINNTNNKE